MSPAVKKGGIMTRVLIADDNLDCQELIDDILEINFKDVQIDRALSLKSFQTKAGEGIPYDLILFNTSFIDDQFSALAFLKELNNRSSRVVLIGDKNDSTIFNPAVQEFPLLTKPFSLDDFGEIIKKTCAA